MSKKGGSLTKNWLFNNSHLWMQVVQGICRGQQVIFFPFFIETEAMPLFNMMNPDPIQTREFILPVPLDPYQQQPRKKEPLSQMWHQTVFKQVLLEVVISKPRNWLTHRCNSRNETFFLYVVKRSIAFHLSCTYSRALKLKHRAASGKRKSIESWVIQ